MLTALETQAVQHLIHALIAFTLRQRRPIHLTREGEILTNFDEEREIGEGGGAGDAQERNKSDGRWEESEVD